MSFSLLAPLWKLCGHSDLQPIDFLCQQVATLLQANRREELIEFGIENGFLNDDLRAQAYTAILDLEIYEVAEPKPQKYCQKLKYASVIEADVHRSFNINKEVNGVSLRLKIRFKEKLKKYICRYFQKNKRYHYYQGFNSITEVLLVTFKENYAFCLLEKISKIFLKDILDEQTLENAFQNYFNHLSAHVTKTLDMKIDPMLIN